MLPSTVGFGSLLRQSLGRATDRLNVAMVAIADLCTVIEQDAVALPVEAVGQDDLALSPDWDTMNFLSATHFVIHLQ